MSEKILVSEEERARFSRILVVDDHPGQLKTILALLHGEGFDTQGCATASEALCYVEREEVGVAIIDLRLPDLEGTQLLEQLRTRRSAIKGIIHTGFGSLASAKEAMNLGAFAYVEKARNPGELINQVHRAVRSHLDHDAGNLESAVAQRTMLLQEREAHYHTLVDYAPVCIHEFDMEGRFLSMNPTGLRMMGVSEESQIKGIPYLDLVLEEDRARIGNLLSAAIQGEPSKFEFSSSDKDGKKRVFSSSFIPIKDSKGAVYKLMGISQDITERTRTEEALLRSEERYRMLYDDNPTMYFTVASDGIVLSVNHFGVAQLGYTVDELVGQPVLNLFHEEDKPKVQEQFTRCLKTPGHIAHWEFRKIRRDGSVLWVKETANVIKGPDDQPVVLIVCEDISERKLGEGALRASEERYRLVSEELEERVQTRTAELNAAVQELESFSYSVSHDLRAPLRAIHGYGKVLLEDFGPNLSSDAHRYLALIRSEAMTMSTLISDLLSFSRLGRQVMKVVELDMGELVHVAFEELMQSEAGRTVRFHLSPDLPHAYGDPALLGQVFANLISNALKFSQHRNPAVIEIEGKVNESHCLYVVRDNGVGFDMHYSNKLFDVFQRLHSKEEFEGSGVGLAIVHRIIQRHGGEVWGDSVLGEGATFSFTLPRKGTAV